MFETITTLLGVQLINLGVGIVANILSQGITVIVDGVTYVMYNNIVISIADNPEAVKNILKKILADHPNCNKIMTSRNGKTKYKPAPGSYTITIGNIPVTIKYTDTEIVFYQNATKTIKFITRLPEYARAIRNGLPTDKVLGFVMSDLRTITSASRFQAGVNGLKLTAAQTKTTSFYIPVLHGNLWTLTTRTPYCNIKEAAMTPEMKEVISDVALFIQNEKAYRDRGERYRRCYLLHGPSNTGKTNTGNIVAEKLDRDVYCMSFGGDNMNDERFTALIQGIPKNPIIIFDEFDKSIARLNHASTAPMDAGTILKVLRGTIPLPDGAIVFLTCNSIEFLKNNGYQHLVSDGRVDMMKEYKTGFRSFPSTPSAASAAAPPASDGGFTGTTQVSASTVPAGLTQRRPFTLSPPPPMAASSPAPSMLSGTPVTTAKSKLFGCC